MADVQALYASLDQARQQLHALALARGLALAVGDLADADHDAQAMKVVGASYNSYVSQIAAVEGPSNTLLFLDHVGDVAIEGAKAGATGVMDALTGLVTGAGDAAGKGIAALLKPLIPVFLVVAGAVVLLVFVAGKSGAVRITKAGV